MMTLINRIAEFLNGQMTRPVPYQSLSQSWFHYLALTLAIVAAVVVSIRIAKADDRQLRRFLLRFALLLFGFELYKQFIFAYQANWSYQWYIFPFQFCSTPMYVAFVAALTKNAKVRQALINFLGTYGVFAGIAVMFYPNDVFIETIGINIQTMVHHGAMMVVGIALLANRVKPSITAILDATLVFTGLVLIAILLNTGYNAWIHTSTFNMFFINPVYGNHLPVLTDIEPLVPHVVFVAIYIVGFALVASLMLGIGVGLRALFAKPAKSSATAASEN